MPGINIEELLAPVSPDSPAGDNLEYDTLFGEMERAAEARAAQEYGETLVESEEADWRTVEDRALEILGRSKDLRAAVYLARAAMHTGGVPSFVAALSVIRGLVDRYWDVVHPALDAEDGPLMRANALMTLADAEATLGPLRKVPLVRARALGAFSLRDIEVAQAGAPGEGQPSISAIDGAFLEADLEQLETLELALSQGTEHVPAIEGAFAGESTPNLAPLRALLFTMREIVVERLSRRGVQGVAGGAEGGAASGGESGSASTGVSGGVNSREDVIRALDMCCAFYESREPSSPVPILLRRAKRLVSKSFLEILRDLVPDGVSQAEALRGPGGDD